MRKILGRFSLRLLLLAAVVALLHWGLLSLTFLDLPLQRLIGIHVFLFLITLLSFAGVAAVWKSNFDIVGFAFLGISLLKMMAAVLYLLPLLREGGAFAETVVMHFFAVYFTYLFIEVPAVLKLLRKGPPSEASE